jgi:hypothetical protein
MGTNSKVSNLIGNISKGSGGSSPTYSNLWTLVITQLKPTNVEFIKDRLQYYQKIGKIEKLFATARSEQLLAPFLSSLERQLTKSRPAVSK